MANFDLFSVFSRISDYIGGNEQRTKEEEINAPWGKNEVSIQEEQKVFSRGEIKGFFNTIGETGETLKESKANANKQETRILELMVEPCTPLEVHRLYCLKYPEVPIWSIRRAMSNMASSKKGLLEKTEQKKTEKYGKSNFVWKKVEAVNNIPSQRELVAETEDAYCPNCQAHIVNERVTFDECCDNCGTEIEWHGE